MRYHCAPRCAPGHGRLTGLDNDPVLEQATLRQQWPGDRRPGTRADVELIGTLRVEPFMNLLGSLATDARPHLVRRPLVEVTGLYVRPGEAAAATRHEISIGPTLGSEIGEANHVRH